LFLLLSLVLIERLLASGFGTEWLEDRLSEVGKRFYVIIEEVGSLDCESRAGGVISRQGGRLFFGLVVEVDG
jgi:hypothetical protein